MTKTYRKVASELSGIGFALAVLSTVIYFAMAEMLDMKMPVTVVDAMIVLGAMVTGVTSAWLLDERTKFANPPKYTWMIGYPCFIYTVVAVIYIVKVIVTATIA